MQHGQITAMLTKRYKPDQSPIVVGYHEHSVSEQGNPEWQYFYLLAYFFSAWG
jgi:hypothetical protein